MVKLNTKIYLSFVDNSGGSRPCVLLTDRLLLQANTAHAHLQSIYIKATDVSLSLVCVHLTWGIPII